MPRNKPRKKIKLKLFSKVKFKPKSAESAVLALLCAGVFGISVFAGVKSMGDYNEKTAQIFYGKSVLAAEDQKSESAADAGKDASLEGKKVSEVMSGTADSVKNLAGRVVRTRRIARQRAAEIALIKSSPVLAGRTKKLPGGRRICPVKSNHPQRGGKSHIDEDCCADYNEYPNPRCYYTPKEMEILKRQ